MRNETINSFDSLISKLTDLAIEKEYVFRGYNKSDEMLPQIIRDKDYRNEESKLLQEFERYGSRYYNANTPMDFMSYAQHFGLPTRLLDFTYNPFIALSFALYSPKSTGTYKTSTDRNFYYIRYASIKENLLTQEITTREDNYVGKIPITDSHAEKAVKAIAKAEKAFQNNDEWSLVDLGLCDNEKNQKIEFNKVINKSILFVDPNQSNQRIVMQQGLFMLPYTLDKEKHKEILEKNTSIIMIAKELRKDLLEYLDTLGYNAYRLMPDLANICNAVKRKVLDERR